MPNNLRVLRGAKPSRINPNEPKPRDLLPTKPGWLTAEGAAEWDRVLPDLAAMGTAKAVDATALAAYCESVALLIRLTAVVEQSGPLITGRDGNLVKNPAMAQRRDAAVEVRMWAREFGLTPSARQPLRVEYTRREAGGPGRLLG